MSIGYGLVLVVHVIVAFFLIAVILLQGGRGGLGEALGGAAAQSLFGGGANTVMTRITAVCAALFMATCLSLALLSTARGRSVVDRFQPGAADIPLPLLPGAVAPSEPEAPVPPTPEARTPAEPLPVTPALPDTTP